MFVIFAASDTPVRSSFTDPRSFICSSASTTAAGVSMLKLIVVTSSGTRPDGCIHLGGGVAEPDEEEEPSLKASSRMMRMISRLLSESRESSDSLSPLSSATLPVPVVPLGLGRTWRGTSASVVSWPGLGSGTGPSTAGLLAWCSSQDLCSPSIRARKSSPRAAEDDFLLGGILVLK
ncbi:uncharacterized protein BJX67DRAFT_351050 [Aspergillus lucknowensis]|uniref:Secreted protein n=1 Tax=Aspergillus lucknowensis TaxID=176173 RepID=A0ABR4LU58_9EURO